MTRTTGVGIVAFVIFALVLVMADATLLLAIYIVAGVGHVVQEWRDRHPNGW